MEYNNEYNLDLYPKKLHWKEGDLTATRTTMWSGSGAVTEGCQVIFYTDENDKLVKVEGDRTARSAKVVCACAVSSYPSSSITSHV